MGACSETMIFQVSDKSPAAGYQALFITVDAPVLARRAHERSGKKFELPPHLELPNLRPPEGSDSTGPVRSYWLAERDTSNSWASVIPWVKKHTKLEIWLKGSKYMVSLIIRLENRGKILTIRSLQPRRRPTRN